MILTLAGLGKQIASCDAKVGYPRKSAAMIAADIARRHRHFTKAANPYRCNVCGLWHLTSGQATPNGHQA
jgi:hypothetical protein